MLIKKINEFIDEEKPDLNDKYVSEEFIGWLGLLGLGARSAIDDIAYLIGCKDLNQIAGSSISLSTFSVFIRGSTISFSSIIPKSLKI